MKDRWFVAQELDDGGYAESKFWTPVRTRRLAETVARRCAKRPSPDVTAYCVIDSLNDKTVAIFPTEQAA